MSTLLITGGAGFIGSNFVRLAMAESDHRLVVLDKLTYAGHRATLRDLLDDPRLDFVEGDIGDRELLDRLFREHRPAAVVNFAAETHVDRSIDTPRPFFETNVLGTLELLDASRRHDLPAEFRFLHVSTDEVYGELGDEGAFMETTPYAPNSPYAASKASADHLVRAYHRTYGLPILITNCSNNYGPYQFPEKLIPLMIANASEGKELPVYGDGMNVRDWLYVEDHCRGVMQVLTDGRLGESYNIGGHGERNNIEVVDRICDALEALRPAADNGAIDGSYRDLKQFVQDRAGHDRRYAIDPTKITDELGWKPRHDFESGLAATVRWYLEHRDWCAEVQSAGAYARERLGKA